MSDEQRATFNVVLARAYVAEANRMILRPLVCWDRLTPEQREQHLEACLAHLSKVSHRVTRSAA